MSKQMNEAEHVKLLARIKCDAQDLKTNGPDTGNTDKLSLIIKIIDDISLRNNLVEQVKLKRL